MNTSVWICLILTLTWIGSAYSQANESPLRPAIHYVGGDVELLLKNHLNYPKTARKAKISGDVIFSFSIDSSGTANNLKLASSPSPLLTKVSLEALESLTLKWTDHEKFDSTAEYLHIFRFRIFRNSETPAFHDRAAKQIKKGNWEKALKFNELALSANQYSALIWQQHAEILTALKRKGADKAKERAVNFGRQVVSNMLIAVKEADGTSSTGAHTPIDF